MKIMIIVFVTSGFETRSVYCGKVSSFSTNIVVTIFKVNVRLFEDFGCIIWQEVYGDSEHVYTC